MVATSAPRCLASWIAMLPTPPAPAWIKTFCPARRSPTCTSACQAVRATRGSDPASVAVIDRGRRATSASGTAMRSAKVPMWSLPGRA